MISRAFMGLVQTKSFYIDRISIPPIDGDNYSIDRAVDTLSIYSLHIYIYIYMYIYITDEISRYTFTYRYIYYRILHMKLPAIGRLYEIDNLEKHN
jgi:hypothetical protein